MGKIFVSEKRNQIQRKVFDLSDEKSRARFAATLINPSREVKDITTCKEIEKKLEGKKLSRFGQVLLRGCRTGRANIIAKIQNRTKFIRKLTQRELELTKT